MARLLTHAVLIVVLAVAALGVPEPARGQVVVINGLDDLSFGTWSGSGNMTRTSLHCVASSASGNLFSITITGNGPGGAFTLVNGVGSLPYEVAYRDDTVSPWIDAQAGVAILNLTGRSNTSNCPGEKQGIRVQIMADDLAAASAGGYSGTLTLIVAPM